MVSETDRQNWREAFEKLGPATLCVALNTERAGMPYEYVQEACATNGHRLRLGQASGRARSRDFVQRLP
jgi:hypothetical protein